MRPDVCIACDGAARLERKLTAYRAPDLVPDGATPRRIALPVPICARCNRRRSIAGAVLHLVGLGSCIATLILALWAEHAMCWRAVVGGAALVGLGFVRPLASRLADAWTLGVHLRLLRGGTEVEVRFSRPRRAGEEARLASEAERALEARLIPR
jgi:hypothetical protein